MVYSIDGQWQWPSVLLSNRRTDRAALLVPSRAIMLVASFREDCDRGLHVHIKYDLCVSPLPSDSDCQQYLLLVYAFQYPTHLFTYLDATFESFRRPLQQRDPFQLLRLLCHGAECHPEVMKGAGKRGVLLALVDCPIDLSVGKLKAKQKSFPLRQVKPKPCSQMPCPRHAQRAQREEYGSSALNTSGALKLLLCSGAIDQSQLYVGCCGFHAVGRCRGDTNKDSTSTSTHIQGTGESNMHLLGFKCTQFENSH